MKTREELLELIRSDRINESKLTDEELDLITGDDFDTVDVLLKFTRANKEYFLKMADYCEKKYEKRSRFMSYKLVYKFYPGFLSQMKKYNDKYKHIKNFKELKKEVISALKNSPRNYVPLNAHTLKGNLKGF